jgi:hypothetical protein
MKNFLVFIIFISSVNCILNAQIVGQISDPQRTDIHPYIDITSAYVEKDGTNLKFVMLLNGQVPMSVPDPCSIHFFWHIDADNNPNTGDNPGFMGADFSIHVAIGSTVQGSIDFGSSLDTSGPVTVNI